MNSRSWTHRSRLEAVLAEQSADRVPFSLWRHFPVDDQSPDTLADAVIAFQRQYDFDFVKVTPASSFCLKDWGVKDHWAGNPEGTRDHDAPVIQTAKDWLKLKPLDPTRGNLGDQLKCLQLIKNGLMADTPVIQTIFNPLSQAKNLVGKDTLIAHIRLHPKEVRAALEVITQTTINFIKAMRPLNLDGVFYAIQHAQYGLLNENEYREFGREYDLRILEVCKEYWLNLLHLHGDDVMFDLVADYPVAIINWHDQKTPPTLTEGQKRFSGIVCGGLRQWETMVYGTPEMVKEEAHWAIHQTDSKRFILGTGCVLPIIAPHSNIMAAWKEILPEGRQ